MTKANNIVVTWTSWSDRFLQAAAAGGRDDLAFTFSDDHDETVAALLDADVVVVGPWDEAMLAAGRKLQWVHAMGGGVEGALFEKFVHSDLPFTCLKPVFATVGAEYSLASMLFFSRRFHRSVENPPLTQWHEGYDEEFDPTDLAGKTVGVIGLGAMGKAVAERAACLGMRAVGMTRTSTDVPAYVDRLYTADERAAMLAECDFVVIAVPSTKATHGIVDATLLSHMKPSAYLIDCSGRPALIDYHALEKAIMNNTIAGVSLQPSSGGGDRYMPPEAAAFWRQDGVMVSTCRGTSVECNAAAIDLFFENLHHLEAGEHLRGLVDKLAGY